MVGAWNPTGSGFWKLHDPVFQRFKVQQVWKNIVSSGLAGMILQFVETRPYRTLELLSTSSSGGSMGLGADLVAMLKGWMGLVVVFLALSLPLKFQIRDGPMIASSKQS